MSHPITRVAGTLMLVPNAGHDSRQENILHSYPISPNLTETMHVDGPKK